MSSRSRRDRSNACEASDWCIGSSRLQAAKRTRSRPLPVGRTHTTRLLARHRRVAQPTLQRSLLRSAAASFSGTSLASVLCAGEDLVHAFADIAQVRFV